MLCLHVRGQQQTRRERDTAIEALQPLGSTTNFFERRFRLGDALAAALARTVRFRSFPGSCIIPEVLRHGCANHFAMLWCVFVVEFDI